MEYRLNEIITFIKGYAFKSKDYSNQGINLVKVSDFTENSIDIINTKKLPYNFEKKYEKFILNTGDILISTVGSWPSNPNSVVGKIVKVPKLTSKALLNQNIAKFNLHNYNIDYDYLYYLLKNKTFKNYIIGTAQGSANQASITLKDIGEFTHNYPDYSDQTKISNFLKKLDDKIEINNTIIANLEELSQTLFKHWFIDFEFPDKDGNPYKSNGGKMVESELGDIPEGWEIQKINQIVNFINGHAFKSKELYKYNKNKKMYHVFKMGHIKQGGGLKSDATKSFYPKGIEKKLEKFVLKKGDILMSMTDMKNKVAILGNTALMNRDDKYIVNQRVGLLRLKEDTYIDYPFLYILTNSNEFLTTLRKKANSGVQVNLTSKAIKEQLVIVPSKNYHNKFNMITKPIYLKIFDLEIENEYLTILRDTLLPKLMSGEIEIPDDVKVNTDELSI